MIRSRLGRWSVYVLVAVLFAIACAYLSHWQFARNEQRAAANHLIEENYDAPPLPLTEVLPEGAAFEPQDEWQPVTMSGSYLPDAQLLVRNRAEGGTSAFEVLVPFALDDGRILVVDRGWLPPGEGDAPDSVPAAPEGETTVVVRLKPGEPLPTSGRGAPEGQLPTIHLPSVAAQTGDETIVDVYGLMVSEDPAAAAAPNPVTAPDIDPGPHLSYAIQWILFAIMGFVFIGYMIRTEIRARREDEADEDDDLGLPAPPRRRRRDRDADEEDALIEGR
ncbi:hypothetical protein GCM10022219_26210 [Microbacterium oryzae]|uniref:SURF1 family cytochrome oxidase biogenesis protein n=1 Tax=Microbacterium oryzae TaxID=743009 RepID=UPI00337078A8